MSKSDQEATEEKLKEQLEIDLRLLRRLLDQRGEPFYKVKALRALAQRLCPRDRDSDSITEALRLAIGFLGSNKTAEWAAALYGLTDKSRGKPLSERRQLAYEISGVGSIETLRTTGEKDLIASLAAVLLDLFANRDHEPENATSVKANEDVTDLPQRAGQSDIDAAHSDSWIQLKADLYDGNDAPGPTPGCLVLVGPRHTFSQLALALYSGFANEHIGSLPPSDLVDSGSPIGRVADLAKQSYMETTYLHKPGRVPQLIAFFKPLGNLKPDPDDYTDLRVIDHFGPRASKFHLRYFAPKGTVDFVPTFCCVTELTSSTPFAFGDEATTPLVIWRWPTRP